MSTNVLICDDSNLARKQVLRSLPDHLSQNVQLAKNGAEALDIIRLNSIDVLFLDLTMPEIDGIGVLQALKDESISLPTFVISADIQPEMQNRVYELGAKAFLRKPVQLELLNECLQKHGLL